MTSSRTSIADVFLEKVEGSVVGKLVSVDLVVSIENLISQTFNDSVYKLDIRGILNHFVSISWTDLVRLSNVDMTNFLCKGTNGTLI